MSQSAFSGLLQVPLLTQKNILVQRRRWFGLCCRILMPIILVFGYLYGLSAVAAAAGGDDVLYSQVVSVPQCIGEGCVTVYYSGAGNSEVDAIMSYFQEVSGLPEEHVQPLPVNTDGANFDNLDLWFEENQNKTSAVIRFAFADASNNLPDDQYLYGIYVNDTNSRTFSDWEAVSGSSQGNVFWEVNQLLQDSILSAVGNGGATMDVVTNLGVFPYQYEILVDDVRPQFERNYVWPLFVIPMLLLFHGPMLDMSHERVTKLHQGLVLMGLSQAAYVISWALYWFIWVVYTAIASRVAIGFLDTTFTTRVDASVMIAVLCAFGFSLISMAVCCASCMGGTKSSLCVSFCCYSVFILAFLGLALIEFNPFFFSFAYLEERPAYNEALWFIPLDIAYVTPLFHFGRIFSGMVTVATTEWDVEDSFGLPEPNFNWTTMAEVIKIDDIFGTETVPISIPSYAQSFNYMILSCPVYLAIAWFTYNQFPGQNGAGANVFTFEYWGIRKTKNKANFSFPLSWRYVPERSDPDVVAAINNVFKPDVVSKQGLVFAGLTKRFSRGLFAAIDQMSFSVPATGCVSLLGHNGAGKTTTINCMLGIEKITTGDAIVCGRSCFDDAAGVRSLIGICLQHDVLWDELTPRQTIRLFARLKGVPNSRLTQETNEILHSVRLTTVADHPVSSFSGGMKRRLSVGVSTAGDPKAIFLDEPTSGLDPLNKRHVWDLVQKLKKTRLVVLTTHSMQEADALSDNIAVMAKGTLKAFGPALRLKELYGLGYHLDVVTDPGNEDLVQELVGNHLGTTVSKEASNAGHVSFGVPIKLSKAMTGFMRVLEEMVMQTDALVTDWGVSHTTLEEVFLNITSGRAAARAKMAARKAKRKWNSSMLPKGPAQPAAALPMAPAPPSGAPAIGMEGGMGAGEVISLRPTLSINDPMEVLLAQKALIDSLIAKKQAAEQASAAGTAVEKEAETQQQRLPDIRVPESHLQALPPGVEPSVLARKKSKTSKSDKKSRKSKSKSRSKTRGDGASRKSTSSKRSRSSKTSKTSKGSAGSGGSDVGLGG